MTRDDILRWLTCEDHTEIENLWSISDSTRRKYVGDDVHLRGLIEFSNYCSNSCTYCGISVKRKEITRYRMSAEEILACVEEAFQDGLGTVVLQSGYDPTMPIEWLAEIVREIKTQFDIAITLSLGEHTEKELEQLRLAGADRYLIRFETSDPVLHTRLHPHDRDSLIRRLTLLQVLRDLGYQTGSGILIGLPGQSFESLADDIILLEELNLDMVGVGPYIPHPQTDLYIDAALSGMSSRVPKDEVMAHKVLALIRLTSPYAHLPSTTAMASINPEHSYLVGLMRGANVVMPNLTPSQYRKNYDIYPGKACFSQPENFLSEIKEQIRQIGRTVGTGRGDSLIMHADQEGVR